MDNGQQDQNNAKTDVMLEVRGITKRFGSFTAVDGLDFKIDAGEIHALLGENGAGKSTLVKMLYGSLQPSEGEIFWQGRSVSISSPSEARGLGIGMVFQHFSLFEALSVAENIALSMPQDFPLSNVGEEAIKLSQKYGLPIAPDAVVGDLSVGERQRVEIIRCLLQDPSLIILDEPTSVLTPQEAENLFKTLKILKDEGRSILFITHRLEEVRQLCDKATILRYGKITGKCNPAEETAGSIARMMVGDNVADIQRSKPPAHGTTLLLLNNLSQDAATPFSVSLKNINLDVHSGEVVGIAGIAGNGQSELFEAISGERQNAPDAIRLSDAPAGKKGINKRRQIGAAFVPEERYGHGAVTAFQLSQNMLLARHGSDKVSFLRAGGILGFIWQEMVLNATRRVCDFMDVRKSGDNPAASSLSGGNLQKFIIGRELDRRPDVLVVNQPSWGVDAGAAAHIRQSIIDLARSGSAVLVISQDLDEIFAISDRVAVIYDGMLSAAQDVGDLTREKLGLQMSGSTFEPNLNETDKNAA